MPGHAGGRQGLLPDQQELRQRPPGDEPPLLRGQDDGGETRTVAEALVIFSLLSCHFFLTKIMSHFLKSVFF